MFRKMKVGDVAKILSSKDLELLRAVEGRWGGFQPHFIPSDEVLYLKKYSNNDYDCLPMKYSKDYCIPYWVVTYHIPQVTIPEGYEPAFEGEIIQNGWMVWDPRSQGSWVKTIATGSQLRHGFYVRPKTSNLLPMKKGEYAHIGSVEEWNRFKEINDLSDRKLHGRALDSIEKYYMPCQVTNFLPFYFSFSINGGESVNLSETADNLKFITEFMKCTEAYEAHKKHELKVGAAIRSENGTVTAIAGSDVKPGQPVRCLPCAEPLSNGHAYCPPAIVKKTTTEDVIALAKELSNKITRRDEILEVVKLAMENM